MSMAFLRIIDTAINGTGIANQGRDRKTHRIPKEALINWLLERISSLRGTRSLAYLVDMSWLLRSVRLALHLVRRINQRFPKGIGGGITLGIE